MDDLTTAVQAHLPDGWTVGVDHSDHGTNVCCEHVVFGEYNVSWPGGFESRSPQPEKLVLDRLDAVGLAEASRMMPELSESDAMTLRRAFDFIAASQLSKLQAFEIISFTQSLTGLSRSAWEWAREAIDVLAPLYEYPAHPEQGDEPDKAG